VPREKPKMDIIEELKKCCKIRVKTDVLFKLTSIKNEKVPKSERCILARLVINLLYF
jgi:hypothetical protein